MPPKDSKVRNRNMGTRRSSPVTDTGNPRRSEKRNDGGGVSVVVGGRESRSHGEGKQGVDRLSKPEERSADADQQADQAWLLGVQRKLYQWSRANLHHPYRDLWNWVTDIRNLRCAWRRVVRNKGRQTPGIDGETVRSIRRKLGEATYLNKLRSELRLGRYRPSPCRRKLIPKQGKPGQFRPVLRHYSSRAKLRPLQTNLACPSV